MKIRWSPSAKRDRAQIIHQIATQNPRSALWMDELFLKAVSRLKYFPFMGRRGVITGTREIIPHESYRVVYQVEGQVISILMILHTARKWPPGKE